MRTRWFRLVTVVAAGVLCMVGMPVRGDTLYVSSVYGAKVYRILSSGAVSAFATVNLLPEGLAFDPRGTLYVGNDGGNWINRISSGGYVSIFATNVNQPYGLAFDSKTNLYAACAEVNRIVKISPGGTVTTFATVQGPYGLAFDASDNLYAASLYGRVFKITPSGVVSPFGPPGTGQGQGLAFDASGNLYVAWTSGTVTKLSPQGTGSTYAAGLNSPVGLAFDNAGNLYVASFYLGTIYRIAPDRTVSTFATVPENPSFIAVYPVPKFGPGPVRHLIADGNLVLSWDGDFVLQSATEIQGPFADVSGASSPTTNSISTDANRFFRLRN